MSAVMKQAQISQWCLRHDNGELFRGVALAGTLPSRPQLAVDAGAAEALPRSPRAKEDPLQRETSLLGD